MLDYTYIRPTDPAAAEAELTEAMHIQAAPVWVDMEYTYDAPLVELVRPSEVAELRVALAAATQQAEQAEAKLAAVPTDALRRYMRYSQVPDHHHRYDAAEQQADAAAIDAWLAQQGETA